MTSFISNSRKGKTIETERKSVMAMIAVKVTWLHVFVIIQNETEDR